MVVLRRNDAGDWLPDCHVRVRQPRIWDRNQAASFQNLFGHEDKLGQVTSQRVANADLVHSPSPVAVTFTVVNWLVVHRGLDRVPLSKPIVTAQLRSHLNQCDGSFVSQDQGIPSDVPPIHIGMIRTALHEFDQRCANACGIHTSEDLTGSGTWRGHLAHVQVVEPNAIEYKGPHPSWYFL
jgi:hypothetical protein